MHAEPDPIQELRIQADELLAEMRAALGLCDYDAMRAESLPPSGGLERLPIEAADREQIRATLARLREEAEILLARARDFYGRSMETGILWELARKRRIAEAQARRI